MVSAKLRKDVKNKFEGRTFDHLTKLKVKFKYEAEKIPYILARHYCPDFVIQTEKGKVYIECKGYLRPEHKSKMVAVKKLHPELDIRILFYAKKKADIKWAEKHGFVWAVDTIPDTWIDGLF